MRCMFDSQANDGLKIIEEIPDISPCMLEGRNGIGKTVAVQLLELVSGTIPEDFRAHPNLWSALRERLHDTAVIIDHLRNNQKIYFKFLPETWPESLPDAVGDWLGEAAIDDRPATVNECASLISVIRIAGDEDLEEMLKRRVRTLSSYIGSAARTVRARGTAIEAELRELCVELEKADPDEIIRDSESLTQMESAVINAKAQARDADQRLTHLLRALETKRTLDAAGQSEASLLARRDDLVAKVKKLTEELQDTEIKAEAADQILVARGGVEKQLADAERLLRYRQARLSNLEREANTIARRLAVNADIPTVRQQISDCDIQLERLRTMHRQLDRVSVVRDLIGEISGPLQSVESNVGDLTLVRLDDNSLTVSQTLAGVTSRGRELEEEPQPAQLRELASEIERIVTHRQKLVSLAEKLASFDRHADLAEQAAREAKQASVLAAKASVDAQSLREANMAVGAAQGGLTKAHSELAQVLQQIGMAGLASRQDAEADLAKALSELGLTETELASAEGTARSALASADSRLGELNDSVTAMRRRLTVRQTDVNRVIDRLISSDKYRWIFELSSTLAASLKVPENRLSTFRSLRATLLRVSESVYEAADYLTGLVGIAETFFSEKSHIEGPRELEQKLRPAFERVLGQRLRETLNRESIRNALFDGAEVVGIDTTSRQLTLRDEQGIEAQRPMEAFSSGERAFAFTQARIADLEPSERPNRLLVLDEFGAFVAADRTSDLAVFLAHEVDRVADQVVVILPLHVNYEAEIKDTRGDLRNRYEDRLSQIMNRGYCAVSLI